MKQLLALLLCGLSLSYAQVEKIYDANGMLRAVNPINKQGTFEGMGYTFYPNGATEKEIPYVDGEIHGTQKEFYKDGSLKALATFQQGKQVGVYKVYYPDSTLKMSQEWTSGKRNGDMKVYYETGVLRIYALLRQDSILFAQNFTEDGQLSSEKIGYINQELDTTDLPEPRVFYEMGKSLQSKLGVRLQVIQPQIPSSFISYSSQDGELSITDDDLFPLILTPHDGKEEVELYVLIRNRNNAEPILKKKLILPVK